MIYCYYDSYDYEGCSAPQHFFSKEDLLTFVKDGGIGGDSSYIEELDPEKKTVSQIWSNYNRLSWDEREKAKPKLTKQIEGILNAR